MEIQRVIDKKIVVITLGLILLGNFIIPQPMMAEDNVFYCMENKEECPENESDNNELNQQDSNQLNDGKDEKEAAKVGLTAGDYIKTIFALVFVVGLLYGLLKFINRRNRLYDKNRLMKNLGGISLGQQKSIQLVAIGNSYFLIGVGDDIRLLKEITDKEEIASLLEYYEETDITAFKGPFEQLINKLVASKKDKSAEEDSSATDFSQMFNRRLTEIKTERKRQLNRLTEKERDQDE